MRIECICTAGALLACGAVLSVLAAPQDENLGDAKPKRVGVIEDLGVIEASMPLGTNAGGRLSPASLDLDTCGCPTTFGQPVCEQQTSWTLDKRKVRPAVSWTVSVS